MRAIAAQRRFDRWLNYFAGLALLVMLAMQVANIVGRKGFDSPMSGTVELTEMLLAVVVFLGLAFSEDLGDHITIDLLHVRLRPRMKAVVDVFANLVSIAVVGLIAWQLFDFTLFTRATGEDTGILNWPMWPFVLVAAIGSVLYTLAMISKVVLRALGEPTEAEAPMEPGEVGGPEI